MIERIAITDKKTPQTPSLKKLPKGGRPPPGASYDNFFANNGLV